MISYSRVSTFTDCPFKYWLRYVAGLRVPFDCRADNPLEIGTMLHEYVELGHDEAIARYVAKYPVVTDAVVDEAVKVSTLGERVRALVPDGCAYETKLDVDGFVGYVDALRRLPDGTLEMLDFKYSNHPGRYASSAQLSVYKHYLERQMPGETVSRMGFLVCPKVFTRRRDSESATEHRIRIEGKMEGLAPSVVWMGYEPQKVADFLTDAVAMEEATRFPRWESKLCDWCDYKEYCLKGRKTMLLPKNERRPQGVITDPDMWIYAESYVGKSTFVDQIDDLLFVNTDGNTQNITSPFVSIADEVVTEGRMTRKVLAWVKFKELLDELAKHDNTFKVIALDLIEDLYEDCRFYIYDQLGIRHESDGGYGKGWDIVRTEFLGTIKRLKALGYRVIYISKEVPREVTYANGTRVTTFAPNLPDKVANVLAGTVTLTLRAYMNERGHYLNLRKRENVFGGGRIDFLRDKCDLTLEAFTEALLEAQQAGATAATKRRGTVASTTPARPVEAVPEEPGDSQEAVEEAAPEERPKRRTRAKRVVEEDAPSEPEKPASEEPAPEAPEPVEQPEQPKRRVRRRRTIQA